MDSKKYIGMDVHKESISIAVMNDAGKVVMECLIETKASMILQLLTHLGSWKRGLGEVRLSTPPEARHLRQCACGAP
jgi:hypothetical protein